MLAQAKSQVIFSVEGTELVSRLIDGQFPNYQQVLPTSHATRAVVEREDLLKAVRLSALIASTAANVVQLKVGEEGSGAITIAANSDSGDAEGEVEAQLEGDGVDDRLQRPLPDRGAPNLGGDQLALEFSGPLSPGVLKPVDDAEYVHVIMPVRTPS